MFVNFNILNQLGSPAINSNTFANRPAAGQTGRLFVSTDTFEIYRDNGTTWDLIGGPGSSTITGTGTATQVAYFTSSQAIGSSANLYWDNTSGFLGVGTAAPTTRIEAVKTDGIGIYANYTTNAGSGSSATAIWAKNVTNSSGYGAVIEETTPNTTAGQYPLLIKHSLSSGTAGVGMGTGVHWQLPDDAGTFKTTQLTVETINAAAATYATRYRFNVQSNGSSTPVAYLNATGLGIFTATPGAALDIHSTGTIAQFNTTAATGNVFLAIQRSGTGLWRIGDTYNGGSNFFELHNTTLASNAIQVQASSNEATFSSTKTYSTGNSIGVAVQHNLTIPNAVNVGLAALGGVNSNLNLTLGGSTTVANTGRQGLEGSTTINFTGAGTLTMTQGTTVRAFSALSSVYAFNGSAVGTITHLAGLRICFPDNPGSAVNITNNYALLINNQTTGTGTVTYTNRWGIYQEGASDLNYMAANLLLGSTVNTGDKLQVTGTTYLSSQLTVGNTLYVDTVFNRVGIGTNSPLSLLHTSGTSNIFKQFTTANNATWIEFQANSSGRGFYVGQDNSTGVSWFGAAYAGILVTSSADPIVFGTNSLERMRITSGGNVEFKGIIYTDNLQNYTGGTTPLTIKTGGAQSLILQTNSTDRLTITSGGNVGIGTNNPNEKLDISRIGGSNGLAITTITSGDPYIRLYDNTTIKADLWWDRVSNYMGINSISTGTPTAINPFSGNVLIGTTTDAGYKLDVTGTFRNTTSAYLNTTSGATHIGVTTGATASVPTGKASLIHSSSGTIFSYTGSFTNPYSQNIQIDIVYTNWGANNVIGVVDLIVALREWNNTGGTAFGKVFATTTGTAATFSTFNTTDITTSQCTLAAASGGNFTLRITIDPSNNTDVYSIYMNVIEGGTGVSISSITVTLV